MKALEAKEPFKTWYSRRAATIEGSLETAMPAGVERSLEKASLEGARIVIGEAEARAEEREGWDASRPILFLLAYFSI